MKTTKRVSEVLVILLCWVSAVVGLCFEEVLKLKSPNPVLHPARAAFSSQSSIYSQ